MTTKTKTALAAAFIFASATAAMAQASGEELQNSQYLNNPSASVPLFQQPYTGGAYASAVTERRNAGRSVRQRRVYEGRNVYEGRGPGERVRILPDGAGAYARQYPYPAQNYHYDDANRHPIESFGGY